jgi:hypothetical protein
MTTQRVKFTTELWTKTGNRTGIFLPIDTLVEVGASLTVKDRPCWVISTGPYLNKCVEKAATELYTVPLPDPDPTQSIMYSRIGDVTIIFRDAVGNIISTSSNDNEIKWLKHP